MEITAAMVRQLRERTGLGMMDCKKALAENDGDFEKARDWLRKRGATVADKKSGRSTGAGCIAASIREGFGCLVQVSSETDFVSRNDDFIKFAQEVAEALAAGGDKPGEPADLQVGGQGVEQLRQAAAMRLGENILIGQVRSLSAKGKLYSYVHHDGSIGVLADIDGGDERFGRDICLHIAAMLPMAVGAADVPEEEIAREREIYAAQAEESGKPPETVAKMIDGRLRKYMASITLLDQQFVKNPDLTVGKHLEQNSAQVHAFATLSLAAG